MNVRRRSSRFVANAVAILVCGVLISPARAALVPSGGINFFIGFPQGEFKEQVPDKSYGLSGEFLVSPATAPIGVGVVFGYGIYGSESRDEPFSTTIPDVTVKVTTTNNILLGHLVLRVEPKSGALRPYVQGLLGFSYLFTKTEIKNEGAEDEEVASSTNLDDAVFSYGGGGGVRVRLHEGRSDGGRLIVVTLDLGADYIVGGEAEYLKEGSIRRSGSSVAFDVIQSKTDLVVARIGVAVDF